MAEDVLRLRATVVNEEFLANIRVMGRELGLMQTKTGVGARNANKELQTLGATVRRIGQELRSIAPAFGGIGLGAAGVGIAMGSMLRTFTDVAKRVVELKYASRELGMSERDIRAWGLAAEKVGISADSMTQGLSNFKKTTDGLKYNIGGVRSELYQMGAGPIVQRMQAATNQADKMREAFDFKDALNASDPSGFKARHFFEMIGLGADKARLSYDQFAAAQAKVKIVTPEEQAAAEKFHETMADLSESWNSLLTKQGIKVFPRITSEIQEVEKLLGLFGKMDDWIEGWIGKSSEGGDMMGQMVRRFREMLGIGVIDWSSPTPTGPDVPSVGGDWMNPGRATGGAVARGRRYTVGERGAETFVPASSGSILPNSFKEQESGSAMAEFTRAIKSGTYDALVEWTSYIQSTGGAAGGFKNAAFTTGDPATAGASAGTGAGAGSGGPAGTGTGVGGPGGGGSAAPQSGGDGGTPAASGPPRNAALNDENGKAIDQQTMKQAESLGRAGNVQGLQKLFAEKGYKMSGPACGIVASGYVKSAGFKPPPGGAVASNWNDWAQPTSAEDINKAGRPFGSMIASSKASRYGGSVVKGRTGGHVMTVIPGTFDPKTNTAMVVDQSGKPHRRNVRGLDLRYAGDEAVTAAAQRRGEQVAQTNPGQQPPNGQQPGQAPAGAQLPPSTGGGQQYLREQRDKFKKEFDQNPALKEKIAALATLESEGDASAPVESLLNRADYMGKSVAGAIAPNSKGKSFYGPLNSPGLIEKRIQELRNNPERMKRAMAGVDRALGGSNDIDLYTDQGSGNDPNMIAGGTGINRKGGRVVPAGTPNAERYNNFGGGPGGHRGSIAWRARQKAAYDAAEANRRSNTQNAAAQPTTGGNTPTNRIDATVAPPQVNGSVAVTVNSNGTRANADARTEGTMFQRTQITQHRQMASTQPPGGWEE